MKSLLIIGFVWPEPDSSAAGGRMIQLISLFQTQGFKVTFASPAQDSAYMTDLSLLNVQKKSIALNCSSFDTYITELNPNAVLFDRFMMEEQFGWRVAENCPQCLRILDTEDLHCLRMSRQKAFKEKRAFSTLDLLAEEVAKREIASILRCDLSLIISQYEMELLKNIFKINTNLLYYLPLLLKSYEIPDLKKLPSFEDRHDFIFIGNFLHEPNSNAVQYLKQTIWPLIKKQLPKVVLNIYGAYPSQKIEQLHNLKEGFIIKGRAKNANEVVLKAKVVLAPLQFGAGIKGKLLEAMQCGTPSVTTSIGAESMYGNSPWNGFIEDNPIAFAKRAIQIYVDSDLWENSQNKGIKILEDRYLFENFEKDFKSKIDYLGINLEEHRSGNFIGELLQHHTLKSTKYMSKWIEAKNNNSN